MGASPQSQDAGAAPQSTGIVDPNSRVGRAVQFAADYTPAALGVAGGIAGGVIGNFPGAVGLSVAGAAVGTGYKQFIEQNILGKQPEDPNAMLGDIGKNAAFEGAATLVGAGIAKGAARIGTAAIESKLGKQAAELAAGPLKYVRDSIDKGREKLMEPVLEFIAKNAAPRMDAEVAGDTAKTLLKSDIQQRYGPFIDAYDSLDKVMQAQPIKDEARYKFTQALKSWGRENHGGDNWRTIQKFANDIDASNNGAQLHSVIGQVEDAMAKAWETKAYKQYGMLKQLRDQTADFAEGETTKLAARIHAGKASPSELQFVQQLAQQRGEADAQKYAKSLAQDFLRNKDKVSTEYATFRRFLEDVGEQTKVRVGKLGPKAFMTAIDEVPSEKLIERMFDPKNAAALREMSKQTPSVFNTVRAAKLNQLLQQASPNGQLDVFAFQKALNKIPAPTRRMLMDDSTLTGMNKALANPRLKALDNLERLGESWVAKVVGNVVEGTRTIGGKAARDLVQSRPGQQLIGRGAVSGAQGLAGIFAPDQQP